MSKDWIESYCECHSMDEFKETEQYLEILGYKMWESDQETTEDRLEKLIRGRFVRHLTEKQMEKLHGNFTRSANLVTSTIRKVSELAAELKGLSGYTQELFLEMRYLLRLCDRLTKITLRRWPDERTF